MEAGLVISNQDSRQRFPRTYIGEFRVRGLSSNRRPDNTPIFSTALWPFNDGDRCHCLGLNEPWQVEA